MNPNDLLTRHREHAEGIVRPEFRFGRERETAQILKAAQIAWMNPRCLESLPIVRNIRIGMFEGCAQSLELQSPQFIDAGGLNRIKFQIAHGFILMAGLRRRQAVGRARLPSPSRNPLRESL